MRRNFPKIEYIIFFFKLIREKETDGGGWMDGGYWTSERTYVGIPNFLSWHFDWMPVDLIVWRDDCDGYDVVGLNNISLICWKTKVVEGKVDALQLCGLDL